MFGDVFGTKIDYSKGILYSSRRQFLVDGRWVGRGAHRSGRRNMT